MAQVRVIDVYGIRQGRLEEVASSLAQNASLPFERHFSEIRGDYYIVRTPENTEKLNLKENYNSIEGELTYPEFENYPLIIEVVAESVARSRELEDHILQALGSNVKRLQRDEFPR